MAVSSRIATPLVSRLIERLNLRYPALFLLLAGLTVLDFAVPDVIPFADELGLLLLTVLLGRWKARRTGAPGASAPAAPPR